MSYKSFIFILPILLCACAQESGAPDQSGDEAVVLVTVDGEPVTLPMLERVMAARGVAEDDHEGMRELLDELIRVQAVANAARAEGVADEPEVQAELRLAEAQMLYGHYLDRAQRRQPVTDAQVREVYDRQLERSGDSQYRIEIIGYDDGARASGAIERIENGEMDYATLRAEARAAGRTVDEPGWIDRSQVPEDFAAALVETNAGGVVGQALEDGRGWFLVHVAEKRELQPPPFEQVREGIARSLLQQRRTRRVESLYEQAEITPMLPLDQAEADRGE